MKAELVKTLIIGGAGHTAAHEVPHLVHHLASELVNCGRSVTVLSKSASPEKELPKGVIYVVGDFSQQELITQLLDTHQEVIHLDYVATPNISDEKPLSELLQNLQPTVQLFYESAVRGVKLVLVSSGGAVYGEANVLPIRETHITRPTTHYGVSKLTLENYAHLYASIHGLKFICVRPSNVYGTGQLPFCGQGFIPTAIASILKGMPIKIFGQYGTIRDYIYVSDYAAGIVSALMQGQLSETYNLGSGIGLSNLDVIQVIKPLMQVLGREVRVEALPDHLLDVKVNVLDSNKLHNHTGWKPKIGFNEGVQLTCEWMIEYEK